MKITSIRVKVLNNSGNKMVGLASITLENMIAINDIKILKSKEGLFLAMPSRATKAGTYKDYVHPINAPVRKAIEGIIFAAYNFCIEENYEGVQFDLFAEFSGTLLEQVISDFNLVSSVTKLSTFSSNVDQIEESEETKITDKSQKTNAFWDWLNG